MKKLFFISFLFIVSCTLESCTLFQRGMANNENINSWIDNIMAKSVDQYKTMMVDLDDGVMPYSINKDGERRNVKSTNWTAGFYPGTLFYLYMSTGDESIYQEGLKRVKLMDTQQYMTTNHDVGFMMFCSYGNLYKIDNQKKYEQILINSAYSLAKRYNPKVGSIRSWGKIEDEDSFIVIIDNMMNLELLLWASKVTGDDELYQIAVNHANTTMKNHFRSDNSSYHVVDYDPKTGKILEKKTAQGYADQSAWARGQAWGLYGFTMMYRETKDKKYLDFSNKIASFILNHPNLPEDKVPYWDFDDPKIPNTYRDASAGAIIASALIELAKYNDKESTKYLNTALTILKTLSSNQFTAETGSNRSFLLKHSVANMNKNAEVDAPLPYADYYYIEALYRYKNYSKK